MSALRFVWKHRTISLLVLAGLVVAWQQHRIATERAARMDAELHADSIAAAEDTTRRVLREAMQGQARYYQRRIVQVRDMTADSVEEALDTEPRVRGSLTARVDSLVVNDSGVTTEGDGVRTAVFDGYREPYTFRAKVAVPPPTGPPPRMRLRVQLDPVPLRVRVGCGPRPSGRAVRPAQATVRGPDWATVRLDSLRAEAAVCNPDLPKGGGLPWWAPVLGGVAAGVGLTLAF